MGNEIVVREAGAEMTVAEIKTQVQTIQRVLHEVMQKGTHYDVLPGCGKKEVLLKPGAEKILATFRIGVRTEIEDIGGLAERRYRVTATGFYIPTGNTVGTGIGECSSEEKKYAWREAVCPAEYDNAPEDRRQIYYKKGYKPGQFEEVKQVRANPADIANTVLKMAKKRAMIDLCLSATACSDIFTQDLDVEGENAEDQPTTPQTEPPKPPQAKPAGNTISEPQAKRLFAILSKSGKSQEALKNYLGAEFGIEHSREIQKTDYERICNWIEDRIA